MNVELTSTPLKCISPKPVYTFHLNLLKSDPKFNYVWILFAEMGIRLPTVVLYANTQLASRGRPFL